MGVTFGSSSTFTARITNVSHKSHFHIGAFRNIRKRLIRDAAKTIACTDARTLIGAQLDYYNHTL